MRLNYGSFSDENLIQLMVSLPPEKKINKETAEQFLLALSSISGSLGFEVIGKEDSVVIQLTCRESDKAYLKLQLQAFFPEGIISEEEGFLQRGWGEIDKGWVRIVDFGLSNEFMPPLKTFKNFDVDPLIGITAALSDLQKGEKGLLQVLFKAVRNPCADSMIRSVTDWGGKASTYRWS